tara:strand:+ start:667 stop:792 length:126 start_codon:yes stop_codon:yes gene_type:complete
MQIISKKEYRIQRIEQELKKNLKKRKKFQNKIIKENKKIKK